MRDPHGWEDWRSGKKAEGLPVVMSPDQTAGILHCAGGGLTGEENSWQPVGNPTSVVSCAALRKKQGHWRYHVALYHVLHMYFFS